MTILQGLQRILGTDAATRLKDFLTEAGNASPDLQAQAAMLAALLDEPLSPARLEALAGVLKDELGDIVQGRFKGSFQPSNLV